MFVYILAELIDAVKEKLQKLASHKSFIFQYDNAKLHLSGHSEKIIESRLGCVVTFIIQL